MSRHRNDRVPLAHVLELLSCDTATGVITRRTSRGGCRAGSVAGTVDSHGYIVVEVDNVRIRAHRIVWAVASGAWPEAVIDHENGNTQDNRISNLRDATQAQNMANLKTPRTNKSGHKGVSWAAHASKWRASIRLDGKCKNLGYFEMPEAASAAYKSAASDARGQYACGGRT